MGPILLGSEDDLYGCRFNLLKKLPNSMFRAPLKTYQDRDEYNFDFEQGDSMHRRAGSPSCADQRSSEPKVFRFERLAACCALAALLSPRQGFQPNRWRESLACITANRQSRHMGSLQRCPNGNNRDSTDQR